MKTYILLLAAIFIGHYGHSQTFKLSTKTKIIDVPGNTFFTYRVVNNKLTVNERNENFQNLNTLTLNADLNLPTVNFLKIEPFNGSEKYLFLYGSYFGNDSSRIAYAIYDGITHSLGQLYYNRIKNENSPATYSPNTGTVNIVTNATKNDSVVKHNAYQIKLDGTFDKIGAEFQSCPAFSYDIKFYAIPSGIYSLFSHYQRISGRTLEPNFSPAEGPWVSAAGDGNKIVSAIYQVRYDTDSVLNIYFYDNSPDNTGWIMSWANQNMVESKTETFGAKYGQPDCLIPAVDHFGRIEDKIYMIGYRRMNGIDDNFVLLFDLNFHELCRFQINIGQNTENKLLVLNDQTYIYHDTGNNLELFRINDCNGLDGTSIENHSFTPQQLLKLSPNPSSNGHINIRWTGENKNAPVTISNALGQTIYNGNIKNGQLSLDLHLSSGLYIVRVAQSTQRFIIN